MAYRKWRIKMVASNAAWQFVLSSRPQKSYGQQEIKKVPTFPGKCLSVHKEFCWYVFLCKSIQIYNEQRTLQPFFWRLVHFTLKSKNDKLAKHKKALAACQPPQDQLQQGCKSTKKERKHATILRKESEVLRNGDRSKSTKKNSLDIRPRLIPACLYYYKHRTIHIISWWTKLLLWSYRYTIQTTESCKIRFSTWAHGQNEKFSITFSSFWRWCEHQHSTCRGFFWHQLWCHIWRKRMLTPHIVFLTRHLLKFVPRKEQIMAPLLLIKLSSSSSAIR